MSTSDWTQALDESSGLYYYYNVLSGETSWEYPDSTVAQTIQSGKLETNASF